jgi:hypothetical protein
MKISIYPLNKQWVYLSRTLFIFIILLFASLNLNAQDRKITISQKQNTILTAFEEIEKQTGMNIAYNESVINIKQTININVTDKSLQEVMTAVLKGTNTTYKIQGKQIIIIAAPKEAPQKKYTGAILDETGETVIGASVAVKGSQTGTVTDIDGNFVINAPAGSTLVVSYIGYTTQEIKLGDNTNLKIVLQENQKMLN